MTEALRALIDFSFQEFGAQKIFGECYIANIGSARVMEKVGMTLETRLIERDKNTGEIDESLRYAILRQDWIKWEETRHE